MDKWIEDLESAVAKGAWNRALRLLRSIESTPSSTAKTFIPAQRKELNNRLERTLDQVLSKRSGLLMELKNVQGTQKAISSGPNYQTTSVHVDRCA